MTITSLNEYEDRAYRALLGVDSATAYEIGKRAGIPLSRCYEVARSLAEKGLALVQPGETPRYRAVEPDEVVARERRTLDALGDELRALRAERERASTEPVWVVKGRDAVLARAAGMIEGAERETVVQASQPVFDTLAEELADARRRGVAVESRLADGLLLIADSRGALLGDLELATCFTQPSVVAVLADRSPSADWLAFEESKLRRLVRIPA